MKNGLGGKQILIAKVGAESKGGGVVYRKSFGWLANAKMDQFEQAKMYEAIQTAFMSRLSCSGVLLWEK